MQNNSGIILKSKSDLNESDYNLIHSRRKSSSRKSWSAFEEDEKEEIEPLTMVSNQVPQDKSRTQDNLVDLIIVLIQIFLSEAPRGIVVPTLYPYLKATGTANVDMFMSASVSLFSVGRLVSAYPLGLMADRLGNPNPNPNPRILSPCSSNSHMHHDHKQRRICFRGFLFTRDCTMGHYDLSILCWFWVRNSGCIKSLHGTSVFT